METIAIYGKGGVGKSFIATNLSVYYAMQGKRVLHVGCDPKRDSSLRLLETPNAVRPVVEVLSKQTLEPSPEDILTLGRYGIACCEAGGPLPGIGCGGRGVARVIEALDEMQLLQSGRFDVAIFDVLGDVVCGGFAAPLREGFARKVVIVVSEEPMAMFAANNIARALVIYKENGVRLAGLVVNLRSNDASTLILEAFARKLGTRILGVVNRDPRVIEGEGQQKTMIEYCPDSQVALTLKQIGMLLGELPVEDLPVPTPLDDNEFFDFIRRNGG